MAHAGVVGAVVDEDAAVVTDLVGRQSGPVGRRVGLEQRFHELGQLVIENGDSRRSGGASTGSPQITMGRIVTASMLRGGDAALLVMDGIISKAR